MKRVVVTGGSGFVGSNLVRRLLRDGHIVHLLLRPNFNPWRIRGILDHIRIHELDISDPAAVDEIVRQIQPEWVFHMAVFGAYSSQSDLSQMIQTNIIGTMNLVNSCVKVGFESFVNTGSSSEYGFKDHAPAENEWVEPNSHYAVTKVSATLFCRYTAQSLRVNLKTLRLYSVYGPFEEPTRLIPKIINEGLRGQLPPLVHPSIARDYVYVDDVCEAYMLAAASQRDQLGAVYNVGTGVQTSLADVVDLARQHMTIKSDPVWGSMAGRVWDTNTWVCENSRISQELGWVPSLNFSEGFKKSVVWWSGYGIGDAPALG